jgi:hypothetical protein
MNGRIDIQISKDITPFLEGAFTFVALQSTINSVYSSDFSPFDLKKRFSSSIKEGIDFKFQANKDELKLILDLTRTLMSNQQFMSLKEREDCNLKGFSDYIDKQVEHYKMLYINSYF